MTENEEFEYVAPAVRPSIELSPGQSAHEVAYRTAHDLLSRRFPVEALEILEPALADDPDNIGLRSMRAWAYMLALGPLRLAAVMSDDYDHHAAVYRVRNRLAQRQE